MSASILLIEDNDINMDVMILILNGLGLEVIPALNGPAGLAIARSQRPDLILCDIAMPHLDGFGVLNAVKSDPDTASIPVIAVTAMAADGDGARLLAAGFDSYLSKPVEIDDLKRELARYLPSWPGLRA
ncbi:MAG: response regulator [Luteimonas sp.]